MWKSDMGSIFHIKNQWNILFIGNYYVNYQNYQNLRLLTSTDTKRTLMHLFIFTNSGQRELVSVCTMYAEYTQLQLTFLALYPCLLLCLSMLNEWRTVFFKILNRVNDHFWWDTLYTGGFPTKLCKLWIVCSMSIHSVLINLVKQKHPLYPQYGNKQKLTWVWN